MPVKPTAQFASSLPVQISTLPMILRAMLLPLSARPPTLWRGERPVMLPTLKLLTEPPKLPKEMILLRPLDQVPEPVIVTCPLAGVVAREPVTANGVAPMLLVALTVASPLNASELSVSAPRPPLPFAIVLEAKSATVVAPTEPVPSSVPEVTLTELLLIEPVMASAPPVITVGPL